MPHPLGKRITKKITQDLLRDSQWVIDAEFTVQQTKVYRHPDGRLLILFLEGGGRLVEANESQAYADMIRATKAAIRENPRGIHVLAGRLPHGSNFVAQIPSLIAELP